MCFIGWPTLSGVITKIHDRQLDVMRIQLELNAEDTAIGAIVEQFRQVVEKTLTGRLDKLRTELQEPVRPSSPAQPPVIVPEGVELPAAERLKAADLRTALLLGKIPKDAGLLIDVKTTAKLLNVSERMVYRLADQQAAPRPVKLGSLVRWRLAEIIEWVDSGCPSKWQWPRHGKERR